MVDLHLSKYVKFREEKFGGVLSKTRTERVFALKPIATAMVREIKTSADERAVVVD